MKTMFVTIEIETDLSAKRVQSIAQRMLDGTWQRACGSAVFGDIVQKQVSVQVADQTKPKAKRPARKARRK